MGGRRKSSPDSSGESVNADEELLRSCVRELGAQVEWRERQRDDREHAHEQRLTQHLQVTSRSENQSRTM